ncbi:Dynamin-type G domain-containing protein [Entamoeba marina]
MSVISEPERVITAEQLARVVSNIDQSLPPVNSFANQTNPHHSSDNLLNVSNRSQTKDQLDQSSNTNQDSSQIQQENITHSSSVVQQPIQQPTQQNQQPSSNITQKPVQQPVQQPTQQNQQPSSNITQQPIQQNIANAQIQQNGIDEKINQSTVPIQQTNPIQQPIGNQNIQQYPQQSFQPANNQFNQQFQPLQNGNMQNQFNQPNPYQFQQQFNGQYQMNPQFQQMQNIQNLQNIANEPPGGLKRKRRRSVDDNLYREIRNKVELERRRIESKELHDKPSHKLHTLFNNLQSLSTSLGIPIETPELVVVGMQSDGKSSFIEALVGFQFNVVESTIGTRRPLIIQMTNDPTKRTPRCCFAKENGVFEERDIPIEFLSREINNKTCEVAGRQNVSKKPLVLRVEYCNCSNLTIIDTPGFRLGGEEDLREDISLMVKELIQPSHRIIVCLEQSTTEWANSVSRPIVKEIDPTFKRTILINTKFDNRVKELTDRDSVDRYLQGDELIIGDKKTIFYYIIDSYIADYRSLLEIEFDEKYLAQIGFHRAKDYLEQLLQKRYKDALVPTAHKLSALVTKTEKELILLKQEIVRVEPSLLRKRSVKFIQLFAKTIQNLLYGNVDINPLEYGQTLAEENVVTETTDTTRLCGGAQIRRLLKIYERQLESLSFTPPGNDEVIDAFGMGENIESTARTVVMNVSRREIKPLMEEAVKSVCVIILRFFTIAISIIKDLPGECFIPQENPSNELFQFDVPKNRVEPNVTGLVRFQGFIETLQNGYNTFTEMLKLKCTEKLIDDFESCVKSVEKKKKVVVQIAEKMFEVIRERMMALVIGKIKTFVIDPITNDLLEWLLDGFLQLDNDKYEHLFNFSEEAMRKQINDLEQQLDVCVKNSSSFNAMIKELDTPQNNTLTTFQAEE